ncbi:hyalin-like [Anneissia japonica]|uniref:hyalin-like n=1 Tax=Anneissia japonica TaxID=1529436 RepID=UPI0014255766|nr:hyalin-like [Anneissia japonica]XP_033121138.1 hyalin-like [Anneissia japonica]
MDCSDGSDEKDEICQTKPCRDNQFDCGKGRICIPLTLYCNGNNDCEGGIDEATCDYPKLNGCPDDLTVGTNQGTNYTEVWWTEPNPSSYTTIKTKEQSHSPGHRFEIINGKRTVHTVRYWVQDVYLSDALCLFNITVIDNESPVVNCPSHSSNFASRESNSAWSVSTDRGSRFARLDWPPVNATDNSGTVASVTSNYKPGDVFRASNVAYQITYTAIDEAGNPGYCSFFITVQDLESPSVECPTHIETRSALVSWDITISDNIAVVHYFTNDSRVTSTNSLLNDKSITLAQSGNFPVGTTFIEYMATDLAWNVGKCFTKVTVQDTKRPTITCPRTFSNYYDYIYGFHRLVTDYGKSYATVIWSPPKVEDNSEGPVTWESYPYTSGDKFLLRAFPPYTVKFTASDLIGNSKSCYVYFTVIDIEPPTITCPTNITNYYDTLFGINRAALDPGSSTSTVTWDGPTVSDNSGRVVSVTSTHQSGDTFAPRFYPPYEVEYTAEDESGNTNFCKIHFLVAVKSASNL